MKAVEFRISINTDNRTVSDTGLTKEYALYHQRFQIKETDFYQHNVDAIQASFASEEENKNSYQTKKPTRTIYKKKC